jgi:hypothetical protein
MAKKGRLVAKKRDGWLKKGRWGGPSKKAKKGNGWLRKEDVWLRKGDVWLGKGYGFLRREMGG